MIQTDIEIYIKSVSPEAIKAWLDTCTSSLEVQSSNPKRQAYWATFADVASADDSTGSDDSADSDSPPAEFEIIVLNKVQSNFSSIWFNTKSTPWANDKTCAQAAFIHFQSNVRCVISSWQEGDAPDQWLNIDSEGESIIDWL
tara:strand:+ start:986 stop:1414 length:429 start_codon:yes stop_codon:yes gene_type:complete